jgi:hypothetical protein
MKMNEDDEYEYTRKKMEVKMTLVMKMMKKILKLT